MKQKILFVSHCFLNDGAKLKNQNREEMKRERTEKREILKSVLDAGIEIIQLPCPEFLLYGANRWGHTASQFDTPFFRRESKKMLEPFLLQIEEYKANPERFELIGVVGINGSPSCAVTFTYDGEWGGELSGNTDLPQILTALKREEKPGIFMKVFKEMLAEKGIELPFYTWEDFRKKILPENISD